MQWWRERGGAGDGPHPDVKVWKEGPTLLRRFLSPDEGRSDKVGRHGLSARRTGGLHPPQRPDQRPDAAFPAVPLELAPWDVMPRNVPGPGKFPYNVGLGQRVRENFMAPFLRLALEPQGPRDQLLRGDFDKAAEDLVGFGARMEKQQKRARRGRTGEGA